MLCMAVQGTEGTNKTVKVSAHIAEGGRRENYQVKNALDKD